MEMQSLPNRLYMYIYLNYIVIIICITRQASILLYFLLQYHIYIYIKATDKCPEEFSASESNDWEGKNKHFINILEYII